MDVSHPGKGHVPTSGSSKPIIITNRPVMQDNVINETPSDDRATAPPLTRPKKVVIMPLTEDTSTVTVDTPDTAAPEPTPEPAVEPVATPEPVANPAPDITPPELKPEEAPQPEPAKPEAEPAVAVPAAKRDDKQLSPMQNDEALRLAQERAARLQHMVEKEQYFLPINAVEERRSRRVALLGLLLVVLLALAWYDVALDASLVPNTFNLPHSSLFTLK